MISRKILSYITLLIFYLLIFILFNIFAEADKEFQILSSNIFLFSFSTTLIFYILSDYVQKHKDKERAFLLMVFRSVKLLVYLFFSLYIYYNAINERVTETVITYVLLYFASSFLEISHVVFFVKKKDT